MSSEVRGAIAERYAAALFDLAEDQSALDAVAGDLRALQTLIRESADLRRLLATPVVGRVEQEKAVTALASRAQFGKLTANFLGVLARNRRLYDLAPIIAAYLARLAARRGEVTAQVISAQDLSETQRKAIDERLRKAVGGKVAIDLKIDPGLLGGLVIKVGSRMVDASLKSKLRRLELAMKGVG